jgi:hypothetical protein
VAGMVEQPGPDREPDPEEVPHSQLPGPEDGPVSAPRERVPNDGDLDVGDAPPSGDTWDHAHVAASRANSLTVGIPAS